MANEITLQATLQLIKSGLALLGNGGMSITQSGSPNIESVQNIGTTTEQLSFGDISAIGYLFVKNLDPTNTVRIGLATPVTSGNAFITLLPGEFAVVPTRQGTIYGIALTAACDVLVVALSL